MKCQYSFEDLNNFLEGNISTDSYTAIEKHLESCEECRAYYSSQVLTGRCLTRDEKVKVDVYKKIEDKLDKNKYISKKKWFYKISGKINGHTKILRPAVAVIVICLITILSFNYRVQIGDFFNNNDNMSAPLSQEYMTNAEILENIKAKGGIEFKLLIKGKDQVIPKEDLINQTISILKERFESIGLAENEMNYDKDKEILSIKALCTGIEKDNNLENSIREIIKTGELTFQEVDESKRDKNGGFLPTGKIVISNNDIKDAVEGYDQVSGSKTISISLKDEGARRFSDATGRLIGKPIAVYMDNKIIISPMVVAQIVNGNISLNGNWDKKEFKTLIAMFDSDKLEVNLDMVEFKNIKPFPQ
ncbi:SecDF P1 head subdomain-containing protein [Pseudobacteroides cellulosolvens]|uniref:Uncharacterized protein n=1 Tax=Pseudobacteroides cellulosolvens ATCC 35603 = DSM 2933 TaxID=398512 RepID=A0A0L6JKM5_9FIRM|nr:zf-HC2 domain-containing protein [Pseudobacteroides cellulosolvens]KNY26258.1 hypothetical protein Bccel_1520 [Pseudobacteroides cellulosolvens ATCC 35603 = DSM 2933]